jgi:hypothetical protein
MKNILFVLLIFSNLIIYSKDISICISNMQLFYTCGESIFTTVSIVNSSKVKYQYNNSFTLNDFRIIITDENNHDYTQSKLFTLRNQTFDIEPESKLDFTYCISDVFKLLNSGWYKMKIEKDFYNTNDRKIYRFSSDVTCFKLCSSMSSSLSINLSEQDAKDMKIKLISNIINMSEKKYNTSKLEFYLVILNNSGEVILDTKINPNKLSKDILYSGENFSFEYIIDPKILKLPETYKIYVYSKFFIENSTGEDLFTSNSLSIKTGEIK